MQRPFESFTVTGGAFLDASWHDISGGSFLAQRRVLEEVWAFNFLCNSVKREKMFGFLILGQT